MERIARRRDEAVLGVELLGGLVLGLYEDRFQARDLSRLERAQDGVLEQRFAEPLAFFPEIDGQAGKDHQRNRVLAGALGERRGSIRLGNGAAGQRVIADDARASAGHIVANDALLLVLQGILLEKGVQRLDAAVERCAVVTGLQKDNRAELTHRVRSARSGAVAWLSGFWPAGHQGRGRSAGTAPASSRNASPRTRVGWPPGGHSPGRTR